MCEERWESPENLAEVSVKSDAHWFYGQKAGVYGFQGALRDGVVHVEIFFDRSCRLRR